jgi:hypothetical protein
LLDPQSPLEPEELIHFLTLDGGGQILSVSLGRVLASKSRCPFLQSLEIGWTIADRWLVIGTDTVTIRQIVEALRSDAPLPANAAPAMVEASRSTGAGIVMSARPRVLGEMIGIWLAYVAEEHPEMLEPAWWQRLRQKQRLRRPQLGVWPTTRELPGAVEVGQTWLNYPADGRLERGDRIIAVNGQPLDEEAPLQSLREQLATADRPGVIMLDVLRGGESIRVEIPMEATEWSPGRLQPVDLLQQTSALLRLFSSASYAVYRPSPQSLRAHLELKLVTATQPGG